MRISQSILLAALLFVICTGCAENPWQRSFQPNPALEGQKFPTTGSVQVRTVEFERMQRYGQDERKLRVESNVSPEDYTPAERLAAKDRLLEALQMPQRGDEIEVLGWSEFEATRRLDPNSKMLSDFAKSIGADYVVISSEFLGRVPTTIVRPMTTYSHAYAIGAGPRGYRRGYAITYTDTTWVPMNVVEDRFLYTAAYLRKMR